MIFRAGEILLCRKRIFSGVILFQDGRIVFPSVLKFYLAVHIKENLKNLIWIFLRYKDENYGLLQKCIYPLTLYWGRRKVKHLSNIATISKTEISFD